jgi:hypothetical protein
MDQLPQSSLFDSCSQRGIDEQAYKSRLYQLWNLVQVPQLQQRGAVGVIQLKAV